MQLTIAAPTAAPAKPIYNEK